MVEPSTRKWEVERQMLYGLKTCLKAVDEIPAGEFLFYNFSEMIDVDKDSTPGYQSKLEQRFNMIGAGKTFLMSLEQKGTLPTYIEAKNDSKWIYEHFKGLRDKGKIPQYTKTEKR